jgi:uncharacterized protein
MTVVGTVRELARYPVKSMQGEILTRASVTRDGLDADRRYAVRDLETGKVASAKDPKRWRALLDCHASLDEDLGVRLPDGRELSGRADDLDDALSALLGRRVALVEAASGRLGTYDSEWPHVPGTTMEGSHEFPVAMATEAVTFADLAALHLMTSATLERLGALAPDTTIEPRRFRPNLVVETEPDAGFVEDEWVERTLRIGDRVELQVTLRTPRCVMTTLSQPGLERDPAVLRAAAENRHEVGGVATFACAGVYAEVVTPGAVQVGDPVRLG